MRREGNGCTTIERKKEMREMKDKRERPSEGGREIRALLMGGEGGLGWLGDGWELGMSGTTAKAETGASYRDREADPWALKINDGRVRF